MCGPWSEWLVDRQAEALTRLSELGQKLEAAAEATRRAMRLNRLAQVEG